MKKSFLYLFTVLCTLNMFTACSDDDSKDPNGLEGELASANNSLLPFICSKKEMQKTQILSSSNYPIIDRLYLAPLLRGGRGCVTVSLYN